METMECLLSRRSCRKYKPDPVPGEIVDKIIEAGLYAPSGMGRQSPIVIAVSDPLMRDSLSRVNAEIMRVASDPFFGAPTVLVVLAKKDVPTRVYDGSVMLANMMTAAQDLGLSSCWIHRAKETFERPEGKALLDRLGIPDEYEGVGNLILGYASEEPPAAKARREGRVYKI
ncbi:MAG: nitroreductase [Olsenella sp.]|nr:nitroreductase [Olsenella sp.]